MPKNIMDLDEDLEDLDLEEASSDEHVRYLRTGWPGSGGFPGGYPGSHGSNSGGSNSNSGQQLRVPSMPNNLKTRASRQRAPKGWDKAKKRSGRHYHGFLLHTYCDCMWGNWYCFCLDLWWIKTMSITTSTSSIATSSAQNLSALIEREIFPDKLLVFDCLLVLPLTEITDLIAWTDCWLNDWDAAWLW